MQQVIIIRAFLSTSALEPLRDKPCHLRVKTSPGISTDIVAVLDYLQLSLSVDTLVQSIRDSIRLKSTTILISMEDIFLKNVLLLFVIMNSSISKLYCDPVTS